MGAQELHLCFMFWGSYVGGLHVQEEGKESCDYT